MSVTTDAEGKRKGKHSRSTHFVGFAYGGALTHAPPLSS